MNSKKPRCISPTDDPVDFTGGGLDLVLGVGGGFGFYKFSIKSIGATGWVASGAGLGDDGRPIPFTWPTSAPTPTANTTATVGPQKTPSHKYTVNRRLTGPNTKCSASQVAGAVNRNAVPGNYGNHVNGQSYDVALVGGMFPIGSITFRSNADGNVFQNVTNSDHMLRWGSVTGRISGNQSSGYSIFIVGEGSNSSSLVAWGNQNFGESQFHVQAIAATNELGAICGR